MRMIESSTSAGRDHHQVRELVDHAQDVGQRRLVAGRAHLVEVLQRARAGERHVGVALLHLAHEVLERDRGLLGRGDHRRQQVRDRVVVRELDLLGVDEHHPHLVRRGLQQDRGQHRVDRARLAGAGRAGHQQVRHLGQVGADRAARDVLAQPHRQRRPVLRRRLEDVAEVHDPAARVRDLDADRLLARDRRQDADVGRGQRVREVVLELRDLADLDARREPQLVAGDVRAGDHPDHARLDVEVPERLDQLRGDLLLTGRVGARGVLGRARERGRVRELPDEVGRVGDVAAVAALRRELLGRDRLRGPALDAVLVLGRVLGEPGSASGSGRCDSSCRARHGLGLGLRFAPSSRAARAVRRARARPLDLRELTPRTRAAPRTPAGAWSRARAWSARASVQLAVGVRGRRFLVVTAVRSSRVVVETDCDVYLITPATDAPVSSSTPARKRNTARMCAPTVPASVVTTHASVSPTIPPRVLTHVGVPPVRARAVRADAERPGREPERDRR